MGLSRVDIYNMALSCIKVGEIIDHVDDEAARRYLLPQMWTLTLPQLLARHEWKFAKINKKLAKIESDRPDIDADAAAVYRWTWTYPADCALMLNVGKLHRRYADLATKYPWTVEADIEHGRVIRTMHDHAYAEYVTDAIPEVYWPASFTNAFVWALASQIARGVNASFSDADSCLKQAEAAFMAAVSADISEQGRALPRNGNFIESRSTFGDPPVGDEDLFSVANFGMAAYDYDWGDR